MSVIDLKLAALAPLAKPGPDATDAEWEDYHRLNKAPGRDASARARANKRSRKAPLARMRQAAREAFPGVLFHAKCTSISETLYGVKVILNIKYEHLDEVLPALYKGKPLPLIVNITPDLGDDDDAED